MPATDPALMPAEELLAHYARHALSPVEVLKAVTERIARHNPEINAFAVMNPRSLEAAGESEGRWRAGRPRGVLDGVPVTVKDLIDLAGFPTRRGSRLTDPGPVADKPPWWVSLKGTRAPSSSARPRPASWLEVDRRLPAARHHPQPLEQAAHARRLVRRRGGGGGGRLRAAAYRHRCRRLVRIPAAWCGVVGLKPSFGRVPQWPLGAFASIAAAGPMTRTVRDGALLFSALCRFDLRNPYRPPPSRASRATGATGIEDGVAEMRVTIIRRPASRRRWTGEGIAAVEQAAQLLTEAGAEVEEADPGLPDLREIFCRVSGVAMATLVEGLPEGKRHLLETAIQTVATANAGLPATVLMQMRPGPRNPPRWPASLKSFTLSVKLASVALSPLALAFNISFMTSLLLYDIC